MWHTKPYEHNLHFNKVECSIDSGPYCKTHDVKVPFYMPGFSSGKIILHHFHVDNNESELGIGYVMIIGRNLMLQLIL